MKKTVVSIILSILLLLCLVPAQAHAAQDFINNNLGAVEAGYPFACTLSDVSFPDSINLSLREGIVPDGCSWYTATVNGGRQIFIEGTPRIAGDYVFSFNVSCVEPFVDTVLQCSLRVNPSQPEVQSGSDVRCNTGDSVSIAVYASKNPEDGGTLSYQWYSNASPSNSGGREIVGAVYSSHSPVTDKSSYYYCVVTNNNGSLSSSVTSAPVYVEVTEPAVSSVTVANMPEMLKYKQGESIDTKGLELNVNYVNGKSVRISEGFTVSPRELDKVGEQLITVAYKGLSCSFPVTVEEPEEKLESLSVYRKPNKTVYTVGDKLDTSGLTIRAYTNLGYDDITEGFTCVPSSFISAGTQTVTVHYQGKNCTFTVEVKAADAKPQGISVNTMPSKLEYIKGEQLNTAGLTLTLSTDQGDMLVTQGFSCSPTVLNTVGQQVISVDYQGSVCSFTVNVKARESNEDVSDLVQRPESGNSPSDAVREDRSEGSGAVAVIIASLALGLVGVGAYVVAAKSKNRRNGR